MNAIKILEAWNTSIRNKSEYPLRHFLPKDCKIEYLSENIDEAKGIIKNFQSHYSQFKESSNETLISLLVAVKFFFLSRQLSLDEVGLGGYYDLFTNEN